jgi:hypothetical protein
VLDDLDLVLWASLPQPEWNAPDAVPRTLRRVAAASSEQEFRAAYNDFLFALGNDHAGTYYPVVLSAVPFLRAVLERGGEWAKRAAIEALIDLTASFEPEPGYQVLVLHDGTRVDLAVQLAAAVAELSEAVRAVAADDSLAERTRAAAVELLAGLAHGSGGSGAT